MKSQKGQEKFFLPENWSSLKSLTLITAPFVSIKKDLITEIKKKFPKNLKLLFVDFKELPIIDLNWVFQLIYSKIKPNSDEKKYFEIIELLKKEFAESKTPYKIIFFNVHIIESLYEAFFSSLESIYEETDNLSFIFHFAKNIETERTKKQLSFSYLPFNHVLYLKTNKFDWKNINVEQFFYQLNENEQVILRSIFNGDLDLRPAIMTNIFYLEKIGLIKKIKNQYIITNQPLLNFLLEKNRQGPIGQFELVKNRVVYEKEIIDHKLSETQKNLLKFLITKKKGIVSKEKIAEIIWGDAAYNITDWAIDKQISRLRKKIIRICGCDPIRILKGKGIIFEEKTKSNEKEKSSKQKIRFCPMNDDFETIRFHHQAFNSPESRYLFSATPKTLTEVKAWLKNSINNEKYDYDSVYYHNRLVGHCGLKNIDQTKGVSEFGTLLYPYSLWDEIGQTIFSQIVKKAREKGIKKIYYHPNANNLKERQAAYCFGFKKLPGKEGKVCYEVI